MTQIGSNQSAISGSPPTPQQIADEALVGTPPTISPDETAQEAAAAALVDLSPSNTGTAGVGGELAAGVPPDIAAAGALVSDLAAQISGSGSQALSAQQLLSADAAWKLMRPGG